MINIVHVDWRDECCDGAGLFSAVCGGTHGDRLGADDPVADVQTHDATCSGSLRRQGKVTLCT